MPAPIRAADADGANIYDALDLEGEGDIVIDDAEIDFSDLEERLRVPEIKAFESIVVVDGAPVVDDAKEAKLVAVLQKIFKPCGAVKPDGIWMPRDAASGKTKGYLFIDFESADGAQRAVRQFDGYRMDKAHVLQVNRFDDFETFWKVPDEWAAPPRPEFAERDHIKSWLLDPHGRDQWLMHMHEDFCVGVNNRTEAAEAVFSKKHWSDYYALWSPLGSYVATIHRQGVALWGGPAFGQLQKFHHTNVKLVDFSPCERTLVSWSPQPVELPDGSTANTLVWDILSGRLLRGFLIDDMQATDQTFPAAAEYATTNLSFFVTMQQFCPKWPLLQWSHDGAYCARGVAGEQGLIQIYEVPSMQLLDKRSIKIEGLVAFSWSPGDHTIAYWTPELNNSPARMTLLKVQTREILRTKNLFSVAHLKMIWQSNGDYLALLIELFNKSRKQTYPSLEILRIREKDVPVEVIEVNPNEAVTQLSWERNGGHRFAMLTTESPKIFAYFYDTKPGPGAGKKAAGAGGLLAGLAAGSAGVSAAAGAGAAGAAGAAAAGAGKSGKHSGSGAILTPETRQLARLDKKGINTIAWSPRGRVCVLGAVQGFEGTIEFWDTEDLLLMKSVEHYLCTGIEWDPTGRYVVSSVSQHKYQTDTGFQVWSLTGEHLLKEMTNGFFTLNWRPRPRTLLSSEQQRSIKRNLKDYSRELEEADLALLSRASAEVQQQRRQQWAQWAAYRRECRSRYVDLREERDELRGYVSEDEDGGSVERYEEWEDEVVEEREEVVE